MTLVQFNTSDANPVLHQREKKEMLSLSTAEDGRPHFRINSSSLAIIQECPRKAFYSLVEGWRSDTESPATLFGRSIHKALEVFYSGDPAQRVAVKYEDLEPLAYGHKPKEDSLIARSVSAFIETAKDLSSLPESDKRSLQNGVWILSEYFKSYIDDPYVAYIDENGPFIERTFTYRLYDKEFIIDIFGTIDFAFRHMKTGEVILGDHKTASYLTFQESSYFDRDKPNHQYTMYMLGAKKVFGLDIEDFMVNVVEVKAKPKTKAARGVHFPRQVTKRTEDDFAELTEVIYDACARFLAYKNSNVWPLGSVEACNKYGGCQFKQICASPKSMRETLLKNKFNKEN